MRIIHRGASALIVFVLSSLGSFGCARESVAPLGPDARAPRQASLESPLRTFLGPRAVLAAPAPRERLFTLRTAPPPEVHVLRRARR
jgi:hypothetical protein